MEKILICVVHLEPLPGSPNYKNFDEVFNNALMDAKAAENGGADAIIIENFGDVPYQKEVGKEVVACMAVVAKEIRRETSIGLGINVLRNDALAALAIAKAVKADFIRVNQLYFGSLTPEGWIEGKAAEVLRYRKQIDCNAMIFADLNVKHAVHIASFEDYLMNVERALPDAVIATGATTGREVRISDLKMMRKLDIPVLAGSGVDAENIGRILEHCDGVIVGTYIKKKGRIDEERVRRLANSIKKR
ncbi:MAG: BtpA/SgcQ family protein [Archaeoglobaceae archaeon]|nr:BtpA/SgcQ family protein [Archaeoglobaceae archaeon]MCX8152423.1 BtpA/SgcQ family protein [Archaeoglobaceae archaeon]MDW8013763.1 BtpA/SgcQ family protein [Archaeoglobaceae archaeon]